MRHSVRQGALQALVDPRRRPGLRHLTAHWGDGYPYRRQSDTYEPPTAAEQHERRVLLLEYVTEFAKDQVRRGNCTGLRLPANP